MEQDSVGPQDMGQDKTRYVFLCCGVLGLLGIGILGISSKFVTDGHAFPASEGRWDANLFLCRGIGTLLGAIFNVRSAILERPLRWNWFIGTVGQGFFYFGIIVALIQKFEMLALVCVLLAGFGSALFNSMCLGMIAVLDNSNLNISFSMGQALCGFAMFCISWIPLNAHVLYSYMLLFVVLGTSSWFFVVPLQNKSNHVVEFLDGTPSPYKKPLLKNESSDQKPEVSNKCAVIEQAWKCLSTTFLSSVILFIVYPVLVNHLQPSRDGLFTRIIYKGLFPTTTLSEDELIAKSSVLFSQVLVGLVNFVDFVGRFSYRVLPAQSDAVLLGTTCVRFLFVPVFFAAGNLSLLASSRPASFHEPSGVAAHDLVFSALGEQSKLGTGSFVDYDVMKIFLVIIFALTNGWTTTAFLVRTPQTVSKMKEKRMVGTVMSLVLVFGLFTGSSFTKLMLMDMSLA